MGDEADRLSVEATAESIEQALTEIIVRRGWALEQLPGKQIWSADLTREQTYRCYFMVEPDNGRFIFYAVLPFSAEPAARPTAAMLLAEINYGMAIGKFELDVRDGELRFSTGIDVSGTALDPVVAETMIDSALEMMDAYGPGLRSRLPSGLPV